MSTNTQGTREDVQPGKVLNLSRANVQDSEGRTVWGVYVVAVTEGTVHGVMIDTDDHRNGAVSARAGWYVGGWFSVTLDAAFSTPDGHVYVYDVMEVLGWPEGLATFLRQSSAHTCNAESTSTDLDTVRREARDEQRRADLAEFERWKEDATQTAHRYADNNNLCGEFDRCMEEIGLAPRERDYCGTVVVTVNLSATGRDADDAAEAMADNIREALPYHDVDSIRVEDVEVV